MSPRHHFSSIFFILSLLFLASNSSTILFTTLGRSRYTFDIFATPTTFPSPSSELRLTDGVSVNYNGFFTSSHLLFTSERNGSSNIYSLPLPLTSAARRELLGLDNPSLLLETPHGLLDRPSLSGDHLLYVSTHHPSPSPRTSWAAVYSTHRVTRLSRRLTPEGVADFSPSASPSGVWTAVASFGDRGWSGEVQGLNTSIYIFKTYDGSERTLVVDRGGWPCWADESTIYFHRQSSDGWWSIYKAVIDTKRSPILLSIERITPPGFHAFTPAVGTGNPSFIAVSTRRPGSQFRHIELIDLSSSSLKYVEVTRGIAPNSHHYNPFIWPDGTLIGYHRCRGGNSGEPPLLFENIRIPSPSPETLSLLRIDGSFPSFSPDGSRIAYVRLPGLFVVKSDGSGQPVEVFKGNAFGTAWDWKRRGVVYTSYGPEFATERTRVDIISINLDETSEPLIKKLTVNGENNAFPSPSPDGKWVVFRSGRTGHKNLYIMDAIEGEAAGLRRLTEGPWSDTMCNWSPDGEWIAFASDRDNPGGGGFAIYMVHPDGTGLRKVVHSGDGGRINHPWFSPDSRSLVFTSDYAAVSAEPIGNPHHYQPYGDIFTVNIDGSDIKRLTHNSYEDGTPTWTPFSLKPADVAEALRANALCSFDDCHWLSLQASPSSVSQGAGCYKW